MEEGKKKRKALSASFVTGAIALVFLIIGYEVAVFIHKAAVTRIEANRDHPDTVYVYVNSGEDATEEETLSSALLRNPVRANAPERVSSSAPSSSEFTYTYTVSGWSRLASMRVTAALWMNTATS